MKLAGTALVLFFAATLVFSIVGQAQSAFALTALSYTSQPTFTSLTSGAFLRAYPSGTGTYFIDAASNSFKSVLVNSTGAVTQTATAPLIGTPVTVTSLTGSTTRTDIYYKQDLGGSTQALNNAGTTFMTEFVNSGSSLIAGQTINSITVYLKKTGAPTGNYRVGCFDSSGNDSALFGTGDSAALTTSYVATTFTSTTTARTLANGDRCGVFFNGGSAGNSVDVQYNNNGSNVFDGTANTIVSTGTGAQGAAAFSSQTARDIAASFSYVYAASNANRASFSATELYENQGQIVRAIQTNDDSVETVRTGVTTILAEKANASSSLIGASTYDTLRIVLKKTGSPTGTITAGVFDSSGNTLATFNTMDAASLTTSNAIYTFQSSSAISIASGQYVGIKFAGGSVGNSVDVAYTATNPFDSTNSVISRFTGSWTDNNAQDMNFKLSQEITGTPNQESGANVVANFGSAQTVNAIAVYWSDGNKIPASVKISTSTDNISYTDRVTIAGNTAVGVQYLTFDTSYSVQYVKVTVVTWGTAKSMQMGYMLRAPTSSLAAGEYAASEVEVSPTTGAKTVYVGGNDAAVTPVVYVYQVDIDTGQIKAFGTQSTTNLNIGAMALTATKNKVYFDEQTNPSSQSGSFNKDLTGGAFAGLTGAGAGAGAAIACIAKTDGASAAADVRYCSYYTTSSGTAVYKITGASTGTSLGTITGNSPTALTLTDTSTTVIGTATAGGTMRTFTITKASDTVSSVLYSVTWINLQKQLFTSYGNGTRTYSPTGSAYYASATQSISYDADTGTLTDPAQLYSETITPGTGTITGIASTFYGISDTLVVTGSGTTWTPQTFTTPVSIRPTGYTETLLAPLTLNSSGILPSGVVRLVCDANYGYPAAGTLYVAADDDCTTWVVKDISTNLVGRQLPYSETIDLVHANEFTYYTFNLSVAEPTIYYLETSYNGKNVDTGNFDSGGQLQQRLLYGQCYNINIEEDDTGNQVMTGNICAGDDLSKTISLSGIVIPDDWLGNVWSYTISRNYTSPSPSNNGLLFVVEKSEKPFDVSVFATDHPDPDEASYTGWFNFTGVTGTAIANVTGINSNQTIFFTAYENEIAVLNAVSSAASFDYGDLFDEFGLLFGLPVAIIFPVLVAAIFPRSIGYFGLIVTGAAIGVMELLGFLSLGPGIWAVAIVMIALGVVMGYKRS